MPSKRRWIWILSGLAAVRVLIFAAAFPFFNNVDEQAHVDLVLKYSAGHPPRGVQPTSESSAYYFAFYGTPEYLNDPAKFTEGEFPKPVWLLPSEQQADALRSLSAEWQNDINFESGEPPLYYAIAGFIWRIASFVFHSAIFGLYSLRFLNAAIIAALVWIGYRAAQLVFPENRFIQTAVPTLIAFFPQDIFFSVQADVLSPLLFGIAFMGLLQLFHDENPKITTVLYTGLALSGGALVKTTNLVLLGVATIALAIRVRQWIRAGEFRNYWRLAALLGACAIAPVAGWIAWNYFAFGDPTATATKIKHLGWTMKPISQWLPHPIFPPRGFFQFWPELIASFWRGEFVWHGKRMAWAPTDAFYWVSSTVALAIGLAALRSRIIPKTTRTGLGLALASFFCALAFIVMLSVSFDFGNCFYPSRERPYFTSGRLMGGALIPFLLIYAYALDSVASRAKTKRAPIFLLGVVIVAITTSEIVVNAPAFASPYNFYHLLVNHPQSDPS